MPVGVAPAQATLSGRWRERAISGVSWSTFETVCRLAVQFVSAVLMARLLDPSEFGVFGMLVPFAALGAPIVEAGLTQALVQRNEISDRDACSAFYVNLLFGVLVAAALFTSAPIIARFYRQPVLTDLARALAATFLVGSTVVVHSALLYRAFRFRALSTISIISTSLATAAGVWAAWKGWGVWSLVVHNVVQSLSSGALTWCISPWRPRLAFHSDSIRPLLRFGSRLQAALVINLVFDRLHYLVIGKFYSAAELGYYTRAQAVQQLPVTNLSGILTRVAFPVFARVASDSVEVRRLLRSALSSAAFLTVPAMTGLAVLAEPLVAALFGQKWLPCVPFLQLLCLAGLVVPAQELNLCLILASGRSGMLLRLEIARKALMGVALLATFRLGLPAIALGYSAALVGSFILIAHYGGQLSGRRAARQLLQMAPYGAASAVMAAAAYGLGSLISFPAPVRLIVQILCGGVLYWLLCHWFQLEGYQNARSLAGQWLRLRREQSGERERS